MDYGASRPIDTQYQSKLNKVRKTQDQPVGFASEYLPDIAESDLVADIVLGNDAILLESESGQGMGA